MEYDINRSRLILSRGDIAKQETDAIVNAANSELTPGGGVSGAIHRAAGPRLWEECRKLGGCLTGEAKITYGYHLPSSHVIHTVGPVYNGNPDDPEDLKNCYYNSLRVAEENGLKSISFPSISTGIFGYPVEDAANIAIKTIWQYLKNNTGIELVQVILFSDPDFQSYVRAARTTLTGSY